MATTTSDRTTYDATQFRKVCIADGAGEDRRSQGELLKLVPTRSSESYAYGFKIDSDTFFIGGAAQKSYLAGFFGDRPSGDAATGDSNDAIIRCSGNNYAANDANFIFRGINASINNRSGGTLGRMEHSFGTQNKSGGTCPTVLGVMITAENYGTCATTFGGADVLLKNEGAVATTEFGVRVRNENNSLATKVGAAFLVTDTGANTGFTYGVDVGGADSGVPTCTVSTVFNGVPTRGASAYEYGFKVDSDVFFTGGAATKSYLAYIGGDRPDGSAASGDSNDALLRMAFSNYAENDTNFVMRGINLDVHNRDSGTMNLLEAAKFTARQRGDAGAITALRGVYVDLIANVGSGAVSTNLHGVFVSMQVEANAPTDSYGFLVENRSDGVYTEPTAAYGAQNRGTSGCQGFNYILDMYDASAAVYSIAPIRFGKTGSEDIVLAVGDFADGVDSGFAPGSIGLDTANGLLFYCDTNGVWQQIAAA